MDDKEYISKTLNIVSDKLGIDKTCDFDNRLSVLYLIKEKNEPLFNELNRIINSFVVYQFVKKDAEMREKMPEMWEKEKELYKSAWVTERDKIMDILRQHNIGI